MESNEYKLIVGTLKGILKKKKISYKKIAEKLDTSEQTIKRIFFGNDCSVGKLINICNAIDINFKDLITLMDEKSEAAVKIITLSAEQENYFLKNPISYILLVQLNDGKIPMAKLKKKYKLSETQLFRYLKKLDDFKLLELQPENKVKIPKEGIIAWRRGGVLQKKFLKISNDKFMDYLYKNYNKDNHFLISTPLRGHINTIKEMITALQNTVNTYEQKMEREIKFCNPEELVSQYLLIGTAAPYDLNMEEILLTT